MGHVGFVAGATGLTGRAVVRHLIAAGARAIAHVRPDSPLLDEHRAELERIGASVDITPWDQAAITTALRAHAPDWVFSLLGTTKKRLRAASARGQDPESESYEAVDYGLSALLRRASEACGHAPRFVYLSAVGVDPDGDTANRYLQARARMERELREGALPYTIVRPGFITGDRDESRPGESIGAGVTNGLLAVAGVFGAKGLRDRYRSITGDALGRACVQLALDPDAENGTYGGDALRA